MKRKAEPNPLLAVVTYLAEANTLSPGDRLLRDCEWLKAGAAFKDEGLQDDATNEKRGFAFAMGACWDEAIEILEPRENLLSTPARAALYRSLLRCERPDTQSFAERLAFRREVLARLREATFSEDAEYWTFYVHGEFTSPYGNASDIFEVNLRAVGAYPDVLDFYQRLAQAALLLGQEELSKTLALLDAISPDMYTAQILWVKQEIAERLNLTSVAKESLRQCRSEAVRGGSALNKIAAIDLRMARLLFNDGSYTEARHILSAVQIEEDYDANYLRSDVLRGLAQIFLLDENPKACADQLESFVSLLKRLDPTVWIDLASWLSPESFPLWHGTFDICDASTEFPLAELDNQVLQIIGQEPRSVLKILCAAKFSGAEDDVISKLKAEVLEHAPFINHPLIAPLACEILLAGSPEHAKHAGRLQGRYITECLCNSNEFDDFHSGAINKKLSKGRLLAYTSGLIEAIHECDGEIPNLNKATPDLRALLENLKQFNLSFELASSISLHDSSPIATFHLAYAEHRLGLLKEAEVSYFRVLKDEPRITGVYRNLAMIYENWLSSEKLEALVSLIEEQRELADAESDWTEVVKTVEDALARLSRHPKLLVSKFRQGCMPLLEDIPDLTHISLRDAIALVALHRACGGISPQFTMQPFGGSKIPLSPTSDLHGWLFRLLRGGYVLIDDETPDAACSSSEDGFLSIVFGLVHWRMSPSVWALIDRIQQAWAEGHMVHNWADEAPTVALEIAVDECVKRAESLCEEYRFETPERDRIKAVAANVLRTLSVNNFSYMANLAAKDVTAYIAKYGPGRAQVKTYFLNRIEQKAERAIADKWNLKVFGRRDSDRSHVSDLFSNAFLKLGDATYSQRIGSLTFPKGDVDVKAPNIT